MLRDQRDGWPTKRRRLIETYVARSCTEAAAPLAETVLANALQPWGRPIETGRACLERRVREHRVDVGELQDENRPPFTARGPLRAELESPGVAGHAPGCEVVLQRRKRAHTPRKQPRGLDFSVRPRNCGSVTEGYPSATGADVICGLTFGGSNPHPSTKTPCSCGSSSTV